MVTSQIDHFNRNSSTRKRRFLDQFRWADHRHNTPVVVGICGPVQHLGAAGTHGLNDRTNDRQVTAFTEVGYYFQYSQAKKHVRRVPKLRQLAVFQSDTGSL